jgi:hypothetical protein
MEDINQIAENCKVFIEQYNSCKKREIDNAEKMNSKFEIEECMIYFDLTKLCVNRYIYTIDNSN